MTTSVRNAFLRVRRVLRQRGISWAIGGLDFSVNEAPPASTDTVGGEPHLCAHAHFAISTADFERSEASVRGMFRPTSRTPRPIVGQRWDGDVRAIAYAFKPKMVRRVELPSDGERRRDHRHREELRSEQRVPMALLLDRLGLADRLILHGLAIEPGDDGPRLVTERKRRRTPP